MQNLTDQHGNKFTLPTCWADVTTAQFCETDAMLTFDERASYFAGRDIPAGDTLDWMLLPPEAQPGKELDLEQQAYEQVELLRVVLSSLSLNQCLPIVWGLYWAKAACLNGSRFEQKRADTLAGQVISESILFCWGGVTHCLAELRRLTDPKTGKYSRLSEPDPTESARRAREAGAEELLAEFGYKNVVKLVATQMNLKEHEVKQLPWGEVAEHLIMQRQSAILADNMQRNARTPADE